jgi:hypothetical protein
MRSLAFSPGGQPGPWSSYLWSSSRVARVTSTHHHSQLTEWDGVSSTFYAWAGFKLNLPNLCLLSSMWLHAFITTPGLTILISYPRNLGIVFAPTKFKITQNILVFWQYWSLNSRTWHFPRRVLWHLSHSPSPLCFSYFFSRSCLSAQAGLYCDLQSYSCFSPGPDDRHVLPHPLLLTEMGEGESLLLILLISTSLVPRITMWATMLGQYTLFNFKISLLHFLQ